MNHRFTKALKEEDEQTIRHNGTVAITKIQTKKYHDRRTALEVCIFAFKKTKQNNLFLFLRINFMLSTLNFFFENRTINSYS